MTTDRELTAAQAYFRLLRSVRAVLDSPERMPLAVPLLHGSMAEADRAISAAGLNGNEEHLLRLVGEVCPRATQHS